MFIVYWWIMDTHTRLITHFTNSGLASYRWFNMRILRLQTFENISNEVENVFEESCFSLFKMNH